MAEILKVLAQSPGFAADVWGVLYTVPAGRSAVVTLEVQSLVAAITNWGARYRKNSEGALDKHMTAYRVNLNYYEHQTHLRGVPLGPNDTIEVFTSVVNGAAFNLVGVEMDTVGPGKILQQTLIPVGTANRTTVYTVPAGMTAMVTRINVMSWSIYTAGYNLLLRRSGQADNQLNQYLLASEPVSPKGTLEFDTPIAMAAGDLLAVSSTVGDTAVSVFGYEQAA